MEMDLLKMIIVDDEAFILESLKTLIDWQSAGVEVVGIADNGTVAIDLTISLRPDIILSDISMPHLTGLEMLERIRKEQMQVEVIFISAHSKFEYAKEAIRHGAFDYILKPIQEENLLETVSRCVEKILASRESVQHLQEATDDQVEHSSNYLINSALEYIRENYHKNITLSQVAQHIYITPAYLSKIFSVEMESTFSHYLLTYRINRAKALLRNTHDKVYEIALQVGYNDTAHFSKLFKQITGQTPSRYRNRE